MAQQLNQLGFQPGFDNDFATEANPSAAPPGQNCQQRAPLGLNTGQISGTPFTTPPKFDRRPRSYRQRQPVRSAFLELPRASSFLIEQDYEAYTEEQHSVWTELVRRRMPQIEQHAAQEYLEGYESLGLPYDRLPVLAALSTRLQRRTGWNATPVNGFMPGPVFFEMLAARRFPTTTWLRSRDSIEYTLEPDIFHDVFGHVPMHAHPVFADFLAHYGKLCVRIEDKATLERLGRVFWYTVEFGLIRQGGKVKVYGSGLISSDGECSSVLHFGCEVRPFVLDEVLRTPVKVDEMHHLLFAIESFDEIYEAMHTLEVRINRGSQLDH